MDDRDLNEIYPMWFVIKHDMGFTQFVETYLKLDRIGSILSIISKVISQKMWRYTGKVLQILLKNEGAFHLGTHKFL